MWPVAAAVTICLCLRCFDWTDLQLFVHACEAGSLTAAARGSHITLAAASARMLGMEVQAGVAQQQRHAHAVLAQMTQLRGELALHGRGAGL